MKLIHDEGSSNRSGNRPFADILRASLSRRNLLARTAALSATGFLASLAGSKATNSGIAATISGVGASKLPGDAIAHRNRSLVNFPILPVAQGSGPLPNISSAYQFEVLIPWGTPLKPGVAEYKGNPNSRPSPADQTKMVGIGHDGMWFFPYKDSNRHGVLAINHEYGTNPHIMGKAQPTALDDVRLAQHAHGVSVIEIKKKGNTWKPVIDSRKNRRIHVNTPVTFSGPAAKSDLLKTPGGFAPRGTLNNCANGYTPWDTYLTCEENFNGYFGVPTGRSFTATTEQNRYGFTAGGFGYGWHNFDPRFDLSNPDYKNEENRFGWVVEIDPMNPTKTPIKRTALGRFKHEGAEVVVGRGGRIVVYMGDDERFEYIYKFVSDGNWRSMRARGISPLDQGKLYVAKFNADNTGNWIELTINNPVLAAKFKNQAEVLTYARIAGDLVGATPMDRPEWIAIAANNDVYCTLTNNTQRGTSGRPGADAANPQAPNPDGHIIRWRDSDHHVGTTFTWDIFVLASSTHGSSDERTFSSPDGLWADPYGRLFIETDGAQKKGLNDQLLVADTNTGEIRRLLSGVTGCEVTGITITPDQRTMFVNIQHPGDGNPQLTNFPAAIDGVTIPRDCTLVITKKDGGIIGS